MRSFTKLILFWPWLTIAIILGITAFFGYQLQNVRIENEVKNFLPDFHSAKQSFLRTEEVFGGEVVAVIGISVDPGGQYKDVFNPHTLQVVDQLHDWLSEIEIESFYDHWIWAKPEEVDAIIAKREAVNEICTPEMLEELEDVEVPEDLTGYVKVVACRSTATNMIDEVISLANMKVIYDKLVPAADPEEEMEHQLMIEDMWEEAPQTQEEADQVRQWVDSWDQYKNNVVSPDYKSTAIYVFIPSGVSIEYNEQLQDILEKKVAEIDSPNDGVFYEIGGIPMISVWLGKYLQSDLARLIPFVFLVIILVLIVSFRNATGVFMPFITVACATIWSVGLTAVMGKPLTLITSSLPTLIVAVGSAYTIHVIHHYFEAIRAGLPKREAIIETMVKVGMAVVMAGLTTVGGFYSLTTSSVIPIKDMGFFASFGAFAALLISVTLVPAMLLIIGRRKSRIEKAEKVNVAEHAEQNPGLLGSFLAKLADFIVTYKKTVLGIALVMIIIGFVFTMKVEVTSNMIEYFQKESPIYTTDEYLTAQFGGTNTFSLVFDGGEDDYWKQPDQLRKLEGLIEHTTKEFPEIGTSMSIVDYIKKMNMALHADDPSEYRIPDSNRAVADCLFLFAQSSDSLESVVDFDYQKSRLTFKVSNGQTNFMRKMKTSIDNWIETNWPEMKGKAATPHSLGQRTLETLGLVTPAPKIVEQKYYYSGMNYIRLVVDRLIVVGQMRSVVLSIIVVFFLAAIIFRSFIGGLLAVVPTALAVLGNFATMGMAGLSLDIGTALVSAAAVGIGIDYAIHYINRYRVERIAGAKAPQAVRRTHLTSGKAIIFNAVAVALGFFVLLFSNFIPVQRLGLLTGITMFTASLIALTLLPVLLVILRPRFIRKATGNDHPNHDGGV